MSGFSGLFDATFELQGAWLPGTHDRDYFPTYGEYVHAHQVEMAEAIVEGATDVIVNTNPTGAGKTLSWAAPAIRAGERGDGYIVFAAYPTNALLLDQAETLLGYLRDYFGSKEYCPDGVSFKSGDSEQVSTPRGTFSLDELVRTVSGGTTLGQSTGEALDEAISDAIEASKAGLPTFLLTTPDTLTLVGANRFHDSDIRSILADVDMVVVDEFHLTNPHGKRILPFHLDYFQRMVSGSHLDRLVFLSATPDDQYIERLNRALDVRKVPRPVNSRPTSEPSRKILPNARLHVQSRPMFRNGRFIAENAEELLEWHDSAGQTLVVVDSIREVDTIYEALDEASGSLDIGRIYGWKRRGRSEVINQSDIVVGNKAVEVGIDFDDLARVVCTAYDPASAVQRLGRMRERDHLDSYEIALLTSKDAHSAIVRAAERPDRHPDQQRIPSIDRKSLSNALDSALDTREVVPYYDLLCAAYARFLWEADDNPLTERVSKTGSGPPSDYVQLVYDHFARGLDRLSGEETNSDPESFWTEIQALVEQYIEDGSAPVFEEMHTYRPSSLSVLILDKNDPEERIKQYALSHVCRYRTGQFLSDRPALEDRYREEYGELTDQDQLLIETADRYVCGYFETHGRLETPRSYKIRQYDIIEKQRNEWGRSPWKYKPERLSSPRIFAENLNTDELDLDDEVLMQYVGFPMDEARERYQLDAYADLLPLSEDDCLALWQDALLVHSHLIQSQEMQ